jgi:uncharacterized phage-associated protein
MSTSSPRQDREKLLHAIIFFTKNTHACHKTKLFKLLFLLDFAVYRETGKSVTGLQYFAWPMGPVPKDLFEELNSPRPDMRSAMVIRATSESDPDFGETKRLLIAPRQTFDPSCFTKREVDTMERLAEIYRDATASQMVEVSHLARQPWHQVYVVEGRHQALIPYALALDSKPGSITKEQADLVEEEAHEADALFE